MFYWEYIDDYDVVDLNYNIIQITHFIITYIIISDKNEKQLTDFKSMLILTKSNIMNDVVLKYLIYFSFIFFKHLIDSINCLPNHN